MKIGLVTLHDYNYGSAIQCFASQTYIEKYYCECELIQKRSSNRWVNMVNSIGGYLKLILSNPIECMNIFRQVKSQRSNSLTISSNSLKEISRFNQLYIKKRLVTSKELKNSVFLNEYDYFFSGSDQVWNGSRVNSYDMFFLRFAPKAKRIAWSPSFGSGNVASYNIKRYKKYISEYQRLSVREESGRKIINGLTCMNSTLLCDPVILLTAEQWRKQYATVATSVFEKDSILLFFIDEISDEALEKVISFQKDTGLPVYSFGYSYKKYEKIENCTHIDGSPFDFLKVLDQCKIIMTDSFHATVFSMLFHSEFYTFTRKYTHNQNQSTRIESLLKRVDDIDRFNPVVFSQRPKFEKYDEYFETQRKISDEFLISILGEKCNEKIVGKDTPVLFKKENECTGCGACFDACPQKCIDFRMLDDKSLYPIIDNERCIGCRKCESVCHIKNYTIKHNSYEIAKVGYSTDKSLYNSSASGGIFAAIANSFLENNGVVYGASLFNDINGMPVCKHIKVDDKKDLIKILNSKYVQSDTRGVFNEVRDLLEEGKQILFSGTSCQIAGLYSFLKKEYTNLYTIDLVCHGVPGKGLLDDYISYIKSKNSGRSLLTFRVKQEMPYTLVFSDSYKINMRDSAYYRMFMAQAGYRQGCYACKYAHRNKPADITLGDFYSREALKKLSISFDQELYSSVLIRSERGLHLLDLAKNIIEVDDYDFDSLIKSHSNLQSASLITPIGTKLMHIYSEKGFIGVQKYISKRNKLVDLINWVKK